MATGRGIRCNECGFFRVWSRKEPVPSCCFACQSENTDMTDTYVYMLQDSIVLGDAKELDLTVGVDRQNQNPQADILVESVTVNAPCEGFFVLQSITLNNQPVEWLSINEFDPSKFARLPENPHDPFIIHRWAARPHIWPQVKLGPHTSGLIQVRMEYTGLIPCGCVRGNKSTAAVTFRGKRP